MQNLNDNLPSHPASCILYPASRILHPASRILPLASRILHPASRILHLASRILLLASCLLLLSACQASHNANTLRLSGRIEATEVALVTEAGGRVMDIKADEGDAVEEGAVLVQLDDAAQQAQIKQARAAIAAAEADLAQVKAGARSEEIAAAQAGLTRAQAEHASAAQAYQDANAILYNPQQIIAQLDAARAAVKTAEQNVAIAESKLGEARWWRDFYDDDKGQHYALNKKIAIAQIDLETAQAQLEGAQAQVNALEAMRRAPVTLQAQAHGALGTLSTTLAAVSVAQAALAELKAGASFEEIAWAQAQVRQAQAQLELVEAAHRRTTLRSPLTGIVTTRSAHAGDTVQPGATLMSIMNLDEIKLVVYVPEAQLPRVRLGMPVQVRVDAYVDQTFSGQVVSIARQAQFSSRDTQERDDRARLVFAVKIRLPNADRRLKAGMPADAIFELP